MEYRCVCPRRCSIAVSHWDLRRRPGARLVFAVETTVEQAMREFAYARGCTELHTPKLMGITSESGAEVFKLGTSAAAPTWRSHRNSTSRWRSRPAWTGSLR